MEDGAGGSDAGPLLLITPTAHSTDLQGAVTSTIREERD